MFDILRGGAVFGALLHLAILLWDGAVNPGIIVGFCNKLDSGSGRYLTFASFLRLVEELRVVFSYEEIAAHSETDKSQNYRDDDTRN